MLRLLIFTALLVACGPKVEEVVMHRSACVVCHQPLDENGQPQGIEDAHPWYPLECTDCHGGQAWVCDGNLSTDSEGFLVCDGSWEYNQEKSHVSPGTGPRNIRQLSSKQLDALDPDYIRFINPGDFRVARFTCGGGSPANDGTGCHTVAVDQVPRSTMAHTSGEIAVARYRAGMQKEPVGIFGAVALLDPDWDETNECASESLDVFRPEPLDPSEFGYKPPTVGEAQDQYMVKSCFRCHLWDFGENANPGDFRSSGCTSCHMPYANDGLSRSADPWVNKQTVPHPVTHQLTKSPPITVCTHCHYRGGRIGISYQGYREDGGKGYRPKNPEVLGQSLHKHDANFYITDEDNTNNWDETPPDLHFEAGMHCVDCHTPLDAHGDGGLYADTQCAVATRCTDCHGSVREYAKPQKERDNFYEEDGQYYLRTRITNKVLRVVQTKDVVTPGNSDYSPIAEESMGINESGFSHTDKMECYTCHAGWSPSCYGCHVTMDFTKEDNYHTTGELTWGKPSGKRRYVLLNDLVLMKNTEGMLAPSMPAERFFMDVLWADPEAPGVATPLYTKKPRTWMGKDGRVYPAFGQRAFNPHTTRRKSQFMACDRCHSVGSVENPENAVLLDLTYGFGTQRVPEDACDVTNDVCASDDCDESSLNATCDSADDFTTYQLDAIQTRDYKPLVVVGHPWPEESRPLNKAEIEAMRNVLVPANPPFKTVIDVNAATVWRWPRNQPFD